MKDERNEQKTTADSEKRRLPYERPSIEQEAEFETLALACTSTPGTGSCYGGYTTS